MRLNGYDLIRRFLNSNVSSVLPMTTAVNRNEMQNEAFVRYLLKQARTKEGWEASLLDTRFVVVDTETTGFNAQSDSLLSLGAVVMEGDRILEEQIFHSLIKPPATCKIPLQITELTGITQDEADQAPSVSDVLQDFIKFAKDGVLVMHHASHDIRFINAALSKTLGVHLTHRVVDTYNAAKWLHPNFTNYELDGLLMHYQIPIQGRHTAIGDALMTAKLWKSILEEALRRQITTLGSLIEKNVLANRK